MKNQYLPTREVWLFEQFLASKPEVWWAEAIHLRYSAEALFLYDLDTFERSFGENKSSAKLPAFFSARVERMLMGFSLENLVKAALLQDPEKLKVVFSREGNLSWGNDGHDLLKLFSEAKIEINLTEQKFVELWQLCALWAGRYPLPAKERDLPRQRKPLPSREALLKRAQKRIEKATAEGDITMGAEIYDLMHSGVGNIEMDIFREIFGRCEALLPLKNKHSNKLINRTENTSALN